MPNFMIKTKPTTSQTRDQQSWINQ